ncbi:MAG: hypothetical protein ABII00_16960 [Elusimicrobiota bacterium]
MRRYFRLPVLVLEPGAGRGYIRASARVPGLAPEVDAFLEQALDPDPARRVRSAGGFSAGMDRLPGPADTG